MSCMRSKRRIYIASDHGGFEIKNFLVRKLEEFGYGVTDFGPKEYDPDDDYPDIARGLINAYREEVSRRNPAEAAGTFALVICRNGVGVSIMANKTRGVRCALSFSPQHAKSARQDDNANFLALPADYISKEVALQTALAFLETPFSNEERHIRRLKKLEQFETETW